MDFFVNLDSNILLFIQEYIRQEWMDGFWNFITSLGDGGWFWIAVSIILLIPKQTRMVGVAGLLALMLGALVTNVVLKNLVARIRPYEVVDGLRLLIERQHDFSFPSGHTCASFAVAMVHYKLLPKVWGSASIVLAALISFSRLYVGVHYPSDVLVGMLVGMFAAWASMHIIKRITKKQAVDVE